MEEWKSLTFDSLKCFKYRIFNSNYGFENYIAMHPPDMLYNLIEFRCGSHRLPIEVGSVLSINRSERECELC